MVTELNLSLSSPIDSRTCISCFALYADIKNGISPPSDSLFRNPCFEITLNKVIEFSTYRFSISIQLPFWMSISDIRKTFNHSGLSSTIDSFGWSALITVVVSPYSLIVIYDPRLFENLENDNLL